jgi:hypothetical protein
MKKISKDRLKVLKEEVLIAERFNHTELRPVIEKGLERYIGTYVPDFAKNWTVLLNEVFPVIQSNLPSIFFRNPRAFLKPRNKTFIKKVTDPNSGEKIEIEGDSQRAAKTQEDILNYIISEIGYKGEVRKVLTDALLFPYGVLWHGYKGNFGMTDEQSMFIKDEQIFVQRVSPLRFIYDPCVSISELDKARWVGRVIDVRYSDLVEDKDLDVDKKQLKGFKGYGNKGASFVEGMNPPDYVTNPKKSLLDTTKEWFRKGTDSNFVRLYEIYVRPTKGEKNEGGKGNIILMSMEQDKPLREKDWVIKAEGFPAKVLEFNPVPDYKFGLADYEIYGPIADQKNAIVNLQLRNAEACTKTYTLLRRSGVDEEDIKKFEDGENTIITYDGDEQPSQKMAIMSASVGHSQELYLIDQRIQKNIEDKSGVTDLKRGSLQSGEESAASVKIRNAGGSSRPMYRQDLMSDFLRESMHYINQLNKQFVTVMEAVRIIGSLDLEWSDEPDIDDLQADTDVEIDAISMLPENPETEAQRYLSLLQLAVDSLSNPKFEQKIAEEGKKFELTPLIEQVLIRNRIRNPNIFRNIKPEEAGGVVMVNELRAAEANLDALMKGQQPPSMPAPGQDHMARIEIYKTAAIIAAKSGNEKLAMVLQQMIQLQAQVYEEEQSKQAQVGRRIK